MKTNYHFNLKISRKLFVSGLLAFTLAGAGLNSMAQQSKAVRVANDQQLLNAVQDASLTSMVLEAGYYASLGRTLGPGINAVKSPESSRSASCIFAIQESAQCFDPVAPETYVCDTTVALTFDLQDCGCCPPNDAGV